MSTNDCTDHCKSCNGDRSTSQRPCTALKHNFLHAAERTSRRRSRTNNCTRTMRTEQLLRSTAKALPTTVTLSARIEAALLSTTATVIDFTVLIQQHRLNLARVCMYWICPHVHRKRMHQILHCSLRTLERKPPHYRSCTNYCTAR
jgi:hypothetical protein